MKRAVVILAAAVLASTMAVGAAEARGGGGFGGGGHMGFGGGAHIGGIAHAGGFGGGLHPGGAATFGGGPRLGEDHVGLGDHFASHGMGLRQHAFHHDGHYRPGYGFYGSYPDCYDWYYLHPDEPLPLSCG
jgi:hypothetical protein